MKNLINIKELEHWLLRFVPQITVTAPSPLAIERNKSKENAIVFDLGGGNFDITVLNISKNIQGQINFEILGTDGDMHLGGSHFDNKLIDYCINEFYKQTGNKIKNLKRNKKFYKKLYII